MPAAKDVPPIPRNDEDLASLHYDVAGSLRGGLRRLGEALECVLGKEIAHATMRTLLAKTARRSDRHLDPSELDSRLDQTGWRTFLTEEADGGVLDLVDLVTPWRDAAEYAGQGSAARQGAGPSSMQGREGHVRTLAERADAALALAPVLLGHGHDHLWEGVRARAALDFGGRVSLEGLRLLSGLSLVVVRNAVSIGDLHPDENGTVTSDEAANWLARRREFCPSRWRDPSDDQWPFDPKDAAKPDGQGNIRVPQATEGERFMPDAVVRPARGTPGISVTIGAKGEERQLDDFYDALSALARMDVARWRRRNAAGNWGIVRARGPWVAVSKDEVDRQLADRLAGAS